MGNTRGVIAYKDQSIGFRNTLCEGGVKLGRGDERARMSCYHSAKITSAKELGEE